jgi:Amiloride-sensitive sodium channel
LTFLGKFEGLFGKTNLSFFSDVSIAFRKPYFVAVKRSELYGSTELFSNFGGLLGLVFGLFIDGGFEIDLFLHYSIAL